MCKIYIEHPTDSANWWSNITDKYQEETYFDVLDQARCGVMMLVESLVALHSLWSRQLQVWLQMVLRLAAETEVQLPSAGLAHWTALSSPEAEMLTELLGMCSGGLLPTSDHGRPRRNPAPAEYIHSTVNNTIIIYRLQRILFLAAKSFGA